MYSDGVSMIYFTANFRHRKNVQLKYYAHY